jgi:hypothetical protein
LRQAVTTIAVERQTGKVVCSSNIADGVVAQIINKSTASNHS